MIYDYRGFPKHTYELKYPAPGAPELGARAKNLIAARLAGRDGRRARLRPRRVRAVPDRRSGSADSLVMISLQRDLDPGLHIAVGKALAPLRDEAS